MPESQPLSLVPAPHQVTSLYSDLGRAYMKGAAMVPFAGFNALCSLVTFQSQVATAMLPFFKIRDPQ